jgi:SAM-dependent methyltransferase
VIARWSGGIADDNMAEDILVELREQIRRHPWWRARTRLTLDLLSRLGVTPPARILDAGCGWGTTLEGLERKGYRAVGADVSRRALEELDQPGRELVEFDLTQRLPEAIERFDAVLALDVIEHLDDDRAAVARLCELARPGGVVVVSVPALPDLFTEFDAIQGHRRRYVPEGLRNVFDGTGLDVEQLFWWGEWMVPILRMSRQKPTSLPGESMAQIYRRYLELPPWPASLVFKAAFALEKNRAIRGKLRVGTSLFAVARRTKASEGIKLRPARVAC